MWHTSRGILLGRGAMTIVGQTTPTLDPAEIAAGAGLTLTTAVTNAAFGDFVLVGPPVDLEGITATSYVSAAGTVSIRLQNFTAGAIDLGSGAWNVQVWRGGS